MVKFPSANVKTRNVYRHCKVQTLFFEALINEPAWLAESRGKTKSVVVLINIDQT